MLTKAVVFLFCIMAVFGLIMANVPTDFTLVTAGTWTTPVQKAVADYFDANNYTLYSSAFQGEFTDADYPYSELNIPTALSTSDWLELYWEHYDFNDPTAFGEPNERGLIMRHATEQSFLGAAYRSGHGLTWKQSNGQNLFRGGAQYAISYEDLVADWNLTGNNDCVFYGTCDHFTATLALVGNGTTTPMEIWAGGAGTITYYLSYEVDLSNTGLSIWQLITSLFGFKPLSLGIGGLGDTLVSGVVGAFMWALVLIILYKVTTGIIPWLSGGSGD